MNTRSTIPIPLAWVTGLITQACHSPWTHSKWRAIPSSLPQDLSSPTLPFLQAPHQWRIMGRSPTCITISPCPPQPCRTPSFIHRLGRPTNPPFLHLIPSTRNPSILAPWTSVTNDHIHSAQLQRTWPTRCRTSSCTIRPMETPCSLPPLVQTLPPPLPPATRLATLTQVRSFQTTLSGLPA